MVCGFQLPSQLVNLAAWGPKGLGLLARESLRRESPRLAFPRNIEIGDLRLGPGSLASGRRAIVPVLDPLLSHAPHLGFLLSLSVLVM